MKKPIIIDTDLDFVIVGPLLSKDGIVIKGNQTTINVIGFANYVFNNKRKEDNEINEVKMLKGKEGFYSFLWSDLTSIGGRKSRFLLCVKGKFASNMDEKEKKDLNIFLFEKFNLFIENVHYELEKFIQTNPLQLKGINIDSIQAAILWNIAHLLLTCKREIDYKT